MLVKDGFSSNATVKTATVKQVDGIDTSNLKVNNTTTIDTYSSPKNATDVETLSFDTYFEESSLPSYTTKDVDTSGNVTFSKTTTNTSTPTTNAGRISSRNLESTSSDYHSASQTPGTVQKESLSNSGSRNSNIAEPSIGSSTEQSGFQTSGSKENKNGGNSANVSGGAAVSAGTTVGAGTNSSSVGKSSITKPSVQKGNMKNPDGGNIALTDTGTGGGKVVYSDSATYNMNEVTTTNVSLEETDFSTLTEEDLALLIGKMSQEEYNEFIKGIEKYYDEQIAYLESIKDTSDKILEEIIDYQVQKSEFIEQTLSAYDSSLYERYIYYHDFGEVLDLFKGTGTTAEKWQEMDYDAQMEFIKKHDSEAQKILANKEEYLKTINQEIAEALGEYEIYTYEDLKSSRTQLEGYKKQVEEAIKMSKNNKDSAKYDYLAYLEEYNNYEIKEYTPEDLKALETDADKYNPMDHPFLSAFDTSAYQRGITYSYTKYKEKHPEITPIEFMKMVEADTPNGGYTIYGIPNYEDLKTITEVSDKFPEFEKTYNYLYEQDPAKAEQYLKDCKYEINNIEGQLRAQTFLSALGVKDGNNDTLEAVANELGVSVEGLADGLANFGSGIYYTLEALGTALGICEENRTMSAEEYKKMYILQALLPEGQKEAAGLIYKDEKGQYVNSDPNSIIDYTTTYSGGFLSNNYEISQGIGNMLPSIAIACFCPAVSVGSVTISAGSIAMGVSAAGNSYHSSMVQGHSYLSSLCYGVFTGASESISEWFLGGLPGLSEVQVTSLKTYLQAMAREGTQEMVQGVMDAVYQHTFMGESLPTTLEGWEDFGKDLLKQGAYGAITAGIMQVPSLVSATLSVHSFKNQCDAQNISVEEYNEFIKGIRLKEGGKGLSELEIIQAYGGEFLAAHALTSTQAGTTSYGSATVEDGTTVTETEFSDEVSSTPSTVPSTGEELAIAALGDTADDVASTAYDSSTSYDVVEDLETATYDIEDTIELFPTDSSESTTLTTQEYSDEATLGPSIPVQEDSGLTPELEKYLTDYMVDMDTTVPPGVPSEIVEFLEQYANNPDMTIPENVPEAVVEFLNGKSEYETTTTQYRTETSKSALTTEIESYLRECLVDPNIPMPESLQEWGELGDLFQAIAGNPEYNPEVAANTIAEFISAAFETSEPVIVQEVDDQGNIVQKHFQEKSGADIYYEVLAEINGENISDSQRELLIKKAQLELELKIRLDSEVSYQDNSPSSIDLLDPDEQRLVREKADLIFDKASSQEKAVTATMESLAAGEFTIEGLEYSQKSKKSIIDKIARLCYQGDSVETAASSINDSLRYTLIYEGDNYQQAVLTRLALLKQQGFSVYDLNNAWGNPIYQGLNVTLVSPEGTLVELQFHTQESFNTKQVLNHEFYELSRNTATSAEARALSNAIQKINQQVYVGDSTTFDYSSAYSLNHAITEIMPKLSFYLKYEMMEKFSKDSMRATLELAEKFGDAGREVNWDLMNGKSIPDILNSMTEIDQQKFLRFLNNTIEGQFLMSLSESELKALTTYTGGDYSAINSALRSGKNYETWKAIIDNIDSAMVKYGGLAEDTQLYRAVDIFAFTGQSAYASLFDGIDTSDLSQVYAALKTVEGKTFSDAGYMSSSPSYAHSFAKYESYPIVLDIVAEEGTAGAYINQISQFYNSENEFLLAAGTKLEMIEVSPPSADSKGMEKIVIKCRVINE